MNVVILILLSDTVYNSDYTNRRLLATSWSQAIDPFCARYEQSTFPGDENNISVSSGADPACVPDPFHAYSFLGPMNHGGDVSHQI
jgi:hypothetical protein